MTITHNLLDTLSGDADIQQSSLLILGSLLIASLIRDPTVQDQATFYETSLLLEIAVHVVLRFVASSELPTRIGIGLQGTFITSRSN
jgi:hypothetical protein